MQHFGEWMGDHQSRWRRDRVASNEQGKQNGLTRPWILARADWEEGLWVGIRSQSQASVTSYLARHAVKEHTGVHNLKSSWIACANLYFPFRERAQDRALLGGFLRSTVSDQIRSIDAIELEYAEDGPLHPEPLLGETGGSRGTGQTSPDIALLANGGKAIILAESKLTEHSFYSCSARTTEDTTGRPANPDPSRCRNAQQVANDPVSLCQQVVWGRKYWERLAGAVDREALAKLNACPAAFAGYQLFRQQALAEGYTQKYDLVYSAVAYDARNEALINSLKSTGFASFPAGWAALFKGKSRFAAWTHQAWVAWVKAHDTAGRWREWVAWIEERYGYEA